MVYHWSLSDSKFPQVSMTLLSILADLINAVVWMVSTLSLIFKSSNFCINPLVIVSRESVTICITVTFHCFFLGSLQGPVVFSFFLFYSVVCRDGKVHNSAGSLFLWIIIIDINRVIDLMSRVFGNGLGDQGSIPGRVIPKTQKIVLDAALLYTQYYNVRIKGKVEQSREWSSALPYTLV